MHMRLAVVEKLLVAARRFTSLAVILIMVAHPFAPSHAHPPDWQATPVVAPLAFDVASVKPSNPDSLGLTLIRPMPGGQTYTARNVPLRLMIKAMYRISDSQIEGGPGWIGTERYDIDAKAAVPSTREELHEMFRTLLADRFRLRFHRETKEMPAYVLTVGKSGAKLKRNESGELLDVPIKPGPAGMIGTRVPISYLAWYVSLQLDRPVVDGTGLEGFYDFTLSPQAKPGLGSPGVHYKDPKDPTEEPGILVALREQLGIEVKSRKAPMEIFLIDHASRPEAN